MDSEPRGGGHGTQPESSGAGGSRISAWPRRILLALDGSTHAAKAAAVVAAMVSPGAKVRAITVQSYAFAPYTGEWGPLSDEQQRYERLQEIVGLVFSEPLEMLATSDCEIQRTNRLGNAAEQILEEADEWKPDLLVVGRAGLGGMSRLLLGSVSTHLVKHSKVPVLVVP